LSNIHDGQPPGGYGGNPRDGIAHVLAQQANPPPGNGAPGVPNNLSVDMPGLAQVSPLGGPQAPAPAMGTSPALGGVAPPLQQGTGMALPGIMQPGQLPMGMAPQTVAGGAPPQPMPPRY
jgi:hypothetical protein